LPDLSWQAKGGIADLSKAESRTVVEKKMLMLFVCFSVFLCVFLCCSFGLLPTRLYGVIHAARILTEGLEKEKPTVGKRAVFLDLLTRNRQENDEVDDFDAMVALKKASATRPRTLYRQLTNAP
jgi:hypothetical protein